MRRASVRSRRPRIALALAVAAAVAGHSALSTAAGTKTIKVKDDVFSPKSVTVKPNTLVTWRWSGSNPHDVKSGGSRKFRSSDLQTSGTYKIRFKKAGTYTYVCTLHEGEGMTGKIVVR